MARWFQAKMANSVRGRRARTSEGNTSGAERLVLLPALFVAGTI